MKPHSEFGKRLRIKCKTFGSVAEICRGLSINRQQFQKYLDGTSLPTPAVLRKICAYLRISESELLGESASASRLDAITFAGKASGALATAFRNISQLTGGILSAGPDGFNPGNYFCYFPLQGNDSTLLRSLVTIMQRGDALYFRRLTLFPKKPGSVQFVARGKNSGVVIRNGQGSFLVGISTEAPFSPSIIAFDPDIDTIHIRSGIALVRTARSHFGCRVMLHALSSDIGIRDALRLLGPVHLNDDSVPRLIATSMSSTNARSSNQVMPVPIDELLSSAAASLALP